MDAGQRSGYVQAVAGRPPLRFHANVPHPLGESRKVVRNLHKFGVQLIVLDTFQDLVESVKAAVEAVVGPPP